MIAAGRMSNVERLRGAVPAAAVHLLLAFALLRGLGVGISPAEQPAELKLVELAPPPPIAEFERPPVPDSGETESERRADPREEGAASPPNIESRATEIVAPVERPVPSPLPAATVANSGKDSTQGAAPVRGPGTGSGGIGTGTGSGDGGGGSGAGGGGGRGGGRLRPPRHLRGSLSDRDYPPGLGEAGINGAVGVIYTVETDGRVTNCSVTRSSGSAILDDTTCSLIERRFRFEPARDGAGRPIRSNLVENYEWRVEDLPDEEEPPPRRRRLF